MSRHFLNLRPSQGAALRAVLGSRWELRERPVETWRRTSLETFDWRLNAHGRLWMQSARTGILVWQGRDARRPLRVAVSGPPRFAGDLPDGKAWNTAAQSVGVRRLLERMELVERRHRIDLLDSEEKVVARLAIIEASAREPESERAVAVTPWVEIEGLRGYRDGDRAAELLADELDLEPLEGDEFDRALRLLGLEPGVDPSKPQLDLDPDAPAREATWDALVALWQIVQRNELGVRQDLDIEFLHDFRVAVRRTRSVLSDLGELFSAPVLERWKQEFSWLGGLTGPTRDLDVFLDNWPTLVEDLEGASQTELEPLRLAAAARRERELTTLIEGLNSDRFKRLSAAWPEFLAATRSDAEPKAGTLEEEVGRRLWKRFKRVTTNGSVLKRKSPAADFHRVRIHGKKLRYLLETFKSLWGADEVKRAVKALKRFQDHLGDFNDAEVHAVLVRDLAESAGLEPRSVLAAGELIEVLRRKGKAERRRFFEFFDGFTADENRSCYRRLSGKGDK